MTLSAAEGERLSRLEGAYEHLATKADVERVRTDVERVRTDVERVRSELKGMKWIIGAGIAGAGAFASIISVAASLAFR